MKCYSPSKLNFDICHATLHYGTSNYANLHYGTPYYGTLYFETSYASLCCETRNCTKCACQIYPATFSALEIKMADGPIDRTTSLFRQSLITKCYTSTGELQWWFRFPRYHYVSSRLALRFYLPLFRYSSWYYLGRSYTQLVRDQQKIIKR